MPIYETWDQPYEKLKKLKKTHICKECGDRLGIFMELSDDGRTYLACTDYRRTMHEGIERPQSRYEKEGLEAFNLIKRRELLTEEIGAEKTRALEKYQSLISLTEQQANEILVSIYPNAPATEIRRAVLLCRSYNLNPLMKHVYLLPFKNKKTGGTDYTTVIGIIAKRLMATRRGRYSYIDDTPRVMNSNEQEIRFGVVDKTKIWAITKLRDTATGAEASGYGFWPASETPYGTEKGNTAHNMAFIRSESQAINKLFPGEMPMDVDVVPEGYAEAAIEEVSGPNVIEGEFLEETNEAPLGICPIHDKPLVPGSRPNYPPYCPTRVTNGKGKEVWCKGIIPTGDTEAPQSKSSPENIETSTKIPETAGYDAEWIKEGLKSLAWKDSTAKSWLKSRLNVDTNGELIPDVLDSMDTEQLRIFCEEIQSRLDMKSGGV